MIKGLPLYVLLITSILTGCEMYFDPWMMNYRSHQYIILSDLTGKNIQESLKVFGTPLGIKKTEKKHYSWSPSEGWNVSPITYYYWSVNEQTIKYLEQNPDEYIAIDSSKIAANYKSPKMRIRGTPQKNHCEIELGVNENDIVVNYWYGFGPECLKVFQRAKKMYHSQKGQDDE